VLAAGPPSSSAGDTEKNPAEERVHMPTMTSRYDEALAYASNLHREQKRKGTEIPYISHLLGVSSLVLEAGGDEDQAIAGLLHDALEDQGDKTSYEEIAARFGDEVARIVRACSDTEVVPKPPWRERKETYLAHLATQDTAVLRVSLADKLHNLRALLVDIEGHGADYLDRFNAGPDDQIWYFSTLSEIFDAHLPGAHACEFATVVQALRKALKA
jgi:(p)ppGpp synthase/HD superfamily hydrolase